MNTSPTSVTTATALQTPQMIRINYPRQAIDRKPDEEQSTLTSSRIMINGAQSSTSSATVPQIINILNPNVIPTGPASANGGPMTNAKKCTFHRQCLHIQSPQNQQPGQQQAQAVSQFVQHHQIQLPLQTPPQLLLHHPQILQQQQIRISGAVNSNNVTSAAVISGVAAINRASTQVNRDAISTNTSPQLNAALLQDRYLLLDLVDGSSFYKCIDIQTQKMLVCKVSRALTSAENLSGSADELF